MWHETHFAPSLPAGWKVCSSTSVALLSWHEVHCPSAKGSGRGALFTSQYPCAWGSWQLTQSMGPCR